jgi:putative peptide zinc metalloprotease protein
VLFAYATWLYRLVVFLGIAALVYTFFIKVVGILLFIVEIVWFVILPVWNEIKLWPALLKGGDSEASWLSSVQRNPRALRNAMLILMLGALAFLPWPTRQSASALLKPVEVFPIHAPAGAQIVQLPWSEGSKVEAGQILLELTSPELQLRWRRAEARKERLQWQASNADVDAEQRQNQQVLQQQESTAESELASVQTDMALYAPRAPFAGILLDVNPELKPGVWVSNRERLGVLVKPDQWQVETWLDEEAVRRIKIGDRARFVTDALEGPALSLKVTAIDLDATRVLPNGQLATRFGGSIVTREKHGQLVPERAIYRVLLVGNKEGIDTNLQSWRGQVVIDGQWEAPALSFMRSALTLIWREFGF